MDIIPLEKEKWKIYVKFIEHLVISSQHLQYFAWVFLFFFLHLSLAIALWNRVFSFYN